MQNRGMTLSKIELDFGFSRKRRINLPPSELSRFCPSSVLYRTS